MDRNTVGRVFEAMAHPQKTEAALEIGDVPEIYSSTDESPIAELESYKDPECVWSEISRFINALEKNRKLIEETEAKCVGISLERANAKLTAFVDHLHFYIACEPEVEFLSTDTKSIILCYEGSVLSVAGQALAQALVSGCAVVLLAYEKFSSTAKHLIKIWNEAGLPVGRLQVRTDFPQSLLSTQPSLKIFVGGQIVDGKNYCAFKPYFLNGFTTPLLVLDGADIESVVSVVFDKAHILRHVEPWALSVIVIEESQLPKFKSLLLERCKDTDSLNTHIKPTPDVQGKQIEHIKKYHLENTAAEIHHLAHYRYIVFGAQPSRANRLWHHDLNGYPLFVLPVRSATEAVAKAYHYGSGYAAAVYTEDGSLSQWASENLQVNTVWINTIGQLHPAAPLPFQVVNTNNTGHCQINSYQSSPSIRNLLYFGTVLDLIEDDGSTSAQDLRQLSQEVQDKVKAAVTAQPAWQALGGLGRSKILFKLFTSCEQRQDVGSTLSERLRKCSAFLKRTTVSVESTYSNQESGIAVTTHLQPCGVIGIYVDNSKSTTGKQIKKILKLPGGIQKVFLTCSDGTVVETIQGAIAYGNTCVVILADDNEYPLIDLIYGAGSCLPKGVVNIIRSEDPSHWVSLVQNMEVKSLWHTGLVLRKEHELLKHFEAKYSKRVWIGINSYLNKIERSGRLTLKFYEAHATFKKHVFRKSQSN